MKIVINCRFLTQPITGVQRYALELCKRLKQDHSGELVFISPRNIVLTQEAEDLGVEKYGVLKSHLWEQIELPRFLRSKGNPILLSLCNTAPLFYKKSIVAIHDLAFLVNQNWFSKTFSLVYGSLIPKIAKKALHIITVSYFSKSEIVIRLGINEDKVSVVYNGHEHLSLSMGGELPEKVKKLDSFFLMVGSLDPRKNIHFGIEAFQNADLGSSNLVIVGESSRSFAIDNFEESYPNIHFAGRVSDSELIELYKNADGFIYPSLYEGFGIPPIEAAFFGLRPILSNISVFREVWDDHALYIDPKDPRSLISILCNYEKLNHSEQIVLTEHVKQYSWDSSAKELKQIVEKIVAF